jgi:hypothetical protein
MNRIGLKTKKEKLSPFYLFPLLWQRKKKNSHPNNTFLQRLKFTRAGEDPQEQISYLSLFSVHKLF